MGTNKKKGARPFAIACMIPALIFLTGGGMGLYSMTCIDLWIPVSISAGAGALSVLLLGSPSSFSSADCDRSAPARFWDWLLATRNYPLCAAAQFLTVGITVFFLFFMINFAGRDAGSRHTERVEVVRVYREKHYKSKRVGRNRYVRGDPYYEHYAEVRLPDNRLKPMRIGAAEVNRYRRMDSVSINIEKGAFGLIIFRKP